MTYLPAAVILPGCLLFLFQECWSTSQCSRSADAGRVGTDDELEISCLIMYPEYVECNWTRPQMQHTNYTFSSVFLHGAFRECPNYLQERGRSVGCRIPLTGPMQRFTPFYTKLSVGGNRSVCKNYTDLSQRVVLSPPFNLSVNLIGRDSEVCVSWSHVQTHCVNHTVGYWKASGSLKISTPVHSTSYCVSPVSTEVVYTFKVRSGMSDLCGPSDFWSDWSEEVQWISKKDVQPEVSWYVMGLVPGFIILISLCLLLLYSERLTLVTQRIKDFVPVVPDPSKSLQDLFEKYNGNVESWVYTSRELKDAFEADYTESLCVVREPSPTFQTNTEDDPLEQRVP